MSNEKNTTEADKPDADIDTARLLGDRANSIYQFDIEMETSVIVDRLKAAIDSKPNSIYCQELLSQNWSDWLDNIHDQGVLLGLELAKKAWDEGHGLNDIMENIAHYKAEIEDYES
ncbi:MAG: hypothetical protein AAFU03_10180 [Bacteroidota bacterium]